MTSEVKDGDAPEFKYIVRLVNTDVPGDKQIQYALTMIRGIGYRTACALADALGVPRTMKIGNLTDEQIEEISSLIENYSEVVPHWMLNRRKEFYTGEDIHLFGVELEMGVKDDINLLRKIRCYRGIRHERGQKVRGQRTRSNGRTGTTIGVVRKRRGR